MNDTTTDDQDILKTAPYLAGLNPPQMEAVQQTEGPLLVLAGAGTGKTRVLTTRFAHLILQGRALPSQVLAVTFTNKAAAEMKERISMMLGNQAVDGWWLGTFHSIAARMLRRHAEKAGLKSNFTILDTDDQLRLIKQILEVESVDVKDWPPRIIAATISRWKDKALTPDQINAEMSGQLAGGKMVSIYRHYQDRLKTLNACDFGDLLLHMIQLFRDPKIDVLSGYHHQFKYIMVDEYQDTNVAQYLWLRLLAQRLQNEPQNICCVGDDDQSIYGWRGAEVGNILRFEQDFKDAHIVRLEQNYRSTGHILAAAASIIAHNEDRHEKKLWTDDVEGELVQVKSLWDGEQEARSVGDEIEAMHGKLRDDGQKWDLNSMAVLVRASFQMREFEERFIQLGLPYRVIGGPRFYERLEIRDALAYFRTLVQPNDDLAFERIINTPKRGIGAACVKQLYEQARGQDIPLYEAVLRALSNNILKPKQANALRTLTDDFERWRHKKDELPHTELAQLILDESGYTQMWMQDKSPEAQGRLENLKELISAMGEFENFEGFIEHVSLVMENQDSAADDMVTLMTMHGAKGLEFDAVFLPGWEEGVFPSQKALDELGIAALEEERRLAYVGITRARKKAFISYAANRRMFGGRIDAMPSRFVKELPEAHIETRSMVQAQTQPRYGRYADNYGFKADQVGDMRAQIIDGYAQKLKDTSAQPFPAGSRIFHQKFGYGTVISVDRDKLDINFDKAGRKKVLDSFVVDHKEAH